MKNVFQLFLLITIISCNKDQKTSSGTSSGLIKDREITLTSEQAKRAAADAESSISAQVAKGLKMTLWASDSLAPDPVAMYIDDKGAAYLTRTVRQKNSEFDIRGYEHWKTSSISWKTVEDRRKFLREYFAPSQSQKNKWLPDLNGDSSHDWKDLAVEREELYKIEDKDNDGYADKATKYIIDIADEVTDIAAGVLVRAKDMFLTMAPDLWRFEDTNGDGEFDKKTSVSNGYAIHVGFSGHNMSGPVEGPDGRIYFNMGDIGANVTDVNGNKYDNSQCGMIGRCNPDGSDFEVFATGLRNTHEFVFDDFGNLISCDNDGDHPGEMERLVHVIQGSDAGWRAHWQYGKYSDPKNNRYNMWMDERMSVARWDSQAAFILPPIQNFHNGPTGMIYNPGTALGKKWLNRFFVVEFVGTPANSKIWSFGLKPKGASFVLDKEEEVVSGIVPTGIQFGPDGALYAADWITGWGTKDYGRIWKLDVEQQDMAAERAKTKEFMALDYDKLPNEKLAELLGYSDRRIRSKAQFALVAKGATAQDILSKAGVADQGQLKRIHAIWGLGQLLRKDPKVISALKPFLADKDEEIVVQTIKMIGDANLVGAELDIVGFTKSKNPRLVFHAIEALGRMKAKSAVAAIQEAVIVNNDQEIYLRHAAAQALYRIGDFNTLTANASHNNKALRIVSIIALRKAKNSGVKAFLNDKDLLVVTEAARAINDDGGIVDALPALADLLKSNDMKYEPLARRILSAALKVGRDQDLNGVYAYANNPATSLSMRKETYSALASWHNPSAMDRVDGRHIGQVVRDSVAVRKLISADIKKLLAEKNPEIVISATGMIVGHNLTQALPDMLTLFNLSKDENVRSSLLIAIDQLKYNKISELVKNSLSDPSEKMRSTAISLIKESNVNASYLNELTEIVFTKGGISEQQKLLNLVRDFNKDLSTPSIKFLAQKHKEGKILPDVELEFFEVVDSLKNQGISAMIKRSKANKLDEYKSALYGGNKWGGEGLFLWNDKSQCVKCHKVNGYGSNVGPDLSKIGKTLTREQILEAIITPSARLAPGYGTMTATLNDGRKVVGIMLEEKDNMYLIKTSDAEPLHLKKSDITSKEFYPSAMPAYDKKLNKKEIRDLVEFLAGKV
jgi:quinoprotein glucose dehydrogenase